VGKRSSLLVGCLPLSLAGQAECEERRVMVVGAYHSPPYGIIDRAQYSGIHIYILRLIAEKLNFDIDILKCPSLKRCYLLEEEGKLDTGVEVVTDNKGYKDYLYYLRPPLESSLSTTVFYLQMSSPNIRTYEDLSGLTVGMEIDVKYFEPFDSDSALKKYQVPRQIQLFKMLKSGRIDVFLDYEEIGDATLNASRFKGLFKKAEYRAIRNVVLNIVVPKKSPFAKDRFKIEAVWRQLVESGKVREIYKQYGVDLPPPTQQTPK